VVGGGNGLARFRSIDVGLYVGEEIIVKNKIGRASLGYIRVYILGLGRL
jgi:hypothetical protein